MKKTFVLLTVAMLSLSCARTHNESVAVDERGQIIDVRTAKEYDGGHLETAVNIPYTEIGEKIADHVKNKEAKITVYCRSGRRSGIAKKTLDGMGYTNVTNAGAYTTLRDKGNEDK
jgi:phage shock protein E